MLLIIVKSDDVQYVKKLWRKLPGLEIADGVYLTWATREKVKKAVGDVKEEIIKTWDAGGRGPLFEIAVVELTEQQYNEVRHMAKSAIERQAAALTEEIDRLLQKIRSSRDRRLAGWYRDVARRYQRLIDASLALAVEPTAVGKLKEKWKELTLEAGRLFK
ncbi:MAG: hypothetical protein QXT46_04145 [Pyrobaculum sp.]|jgi:hypothetical protein